MTFCVICNQFMNVDTLYVESRFYVNQSNIQKLEMHAPVLNTILSPFTYAKINKIKKPQNISYAEIS